MPIQSKYSNEQIETIVNQLLETLRQQNANTELSLMCLGNTISHILQNQFPTSQRAEVAKSFAQVLVDSVTDRSH